jgi:hypothetical protein
VSIHDSLADESALEKMMVGVDPPCFQHGVLEPHLDFDESPEQTELEDHVLPERKSQVRQGGTSSK